MIVVHCAAVQKTKSALGLADLESTSVWTVSSYMYACMGYFICTLICTFAASIALRLSFSRPLLNKINVTHDKFFHTIIRIRRKEIA